jgi:hypothetical protein
MVNLSTKTHAQGRHELFMDVKREIRIYGKVCLK